MENAEQRISEIESEITQLEGKISQLKNELEKLERFGKKPTIAPSDEELDNIVNNLI